MRGSLAALLALALTGAFNAYQSGKREQVMLPHTHGLGYVREGRVLFAATTV